MKKETIPKVGQTVVLSDLGELKILRRFKAPDGDWIFHAASITGKEYSLTLAQLTPLTAKTRGERAKDWIKKLFRRK